MLKVRRAYALLGATGVGAMVVGGCAGGTPQSSPDHPSPGPSVGLGSEARHPAVDGSAATSASGNAAPAASLAAAPPRRVKLATLLDDVDALLGREVLVSGFVIPGAGGCLDVECSNASGCCGTCSSEAVLVANPAQPDAEDRLALVAEPDAGLPTEFGSCRDSRDCQMRCSPLQGRRIRLRGTVRKTYGVAVLVVSSFR